MGVDAARERLAEFQGQALNALAPFGPDAEMLAATVDLWRTGSIDREGVRGLRICHPRDINLAVPCGQLTLPLKWGESLPLQGFDPNRYPSPASRDQLCGKCSVV